MNDKQLRGFIRIVEQGSFTAAADDLFITQSALSQQMKLLEQDLGFNLFDHRTHKATLTDAGRAFCERARQIMALYERSVDEGLFFQKMEQERRRPLLLGCLDEQFLGIWLDLYCVLEKLRPNFNPAAVRYENREELIRALLSGECQASVQLENRDYERAGLLFVPFASVHEMAFFVGGPPVEDGRVCTVEELASHTIAFHNERGECLYEDALRHHLSVAHPTTHILEREAFGRIGDHRSVVLLVPSLQMPERARHFAVPLEWNGAMRLGVVMPPEPDSIAQDYAAVIQEYFAEHPSPWL